MPFRLRSAARRDLSTIWLATAEERGVDQAEDYVRGIEDTIANLQRFPNRAPSFRTRIGDFRKAASGSHLIFYMLQDGSIDVVRILHKRMDIDRALTGDGEL
ncbi:type II toxin-antitoxin system RelE/ParE family toxin [Aurantiacibacter aquimixticola]|uniref:Type II toxin-antitoxin system RelE/ParE family toxin n=1 Tax=Aurantiacibacter aquimixticola TaxID=1958945 RepID=A0A419RSL0_9SPHN|nr:type II toxin-antitoxin system RelE/ParE family toxin [Aurantiacibacter aquimixticola]RJY08766.1 type II toxin-antitoxin system RelE/ParE family toxin [Aurantiacibacter aquimixticola]